MERSVSTPSIAPVHAAPSTSIPGTVKRRLSQRLTAESQRNARYAMRVTAGPLCRNGQRLHDVLDDRLRAAAREPRLVVEREAVREHGHRELADVLGAHERLAVDQRERLRGASERERAARACAH